MEQIRIKDMDGQPMFVPHPYLSKMMMDRDAASTIACNLYTAMIAECMEESDPSFPSLSANYYAQCTSALSWLMDRGHLSTEEVTCSYAELRPDLDGFQFVVYGDDAKFRGFVEIDFVSGIVYRYNPEDGFVSRS